MTKKTFPKLKKIVEYSKEKFFLEKIEYKKMRYKRRNERDMDDDEIEQYKFKIFILYSLIICLPLIFLIIMLYR